jgi:anti-anti-sigma factor
MSEERPSMPHPFVVQQSPDGDVTVLSVDGYLDAHTAPEFERAVQAAIDAGRVRLVVDGAQLKYISSAGLCS